MIRNFGDVYLTAGKSSEHPAVRSKLYGIVFQAVVRDILFDEWAATQEIPYRLSKEWTVLNCRFIVAEPALKPVGIFIPLGTRKTLVAERLREILGIGTFLFKEEEKPGDACARARRLSEYRNDLDPGSMGWLAKHIFSCDACRIVIK
ncbi:MAG: hypothetical protein KGJ13_07590 [Patescibacteria group bacterium]|nr:hypothetical protein [Patescibacteria group bacterium]